MEYDSYGNPMGAVCKQMQHDDSDGDMVEAVRGQSLGEDKERPRDCGSHGGVDSNGRERHARSSHQSNRSNGSGLAVLPARSSRSQSKRGSGGVGASSSTTTPSAYRSSGPGD